MGGQGQVAWRRMGGARLGGRMAGALGKRGFDAELNVSPLPYERAPPRLTLISHQHLAPPFIPRPPAHSAPFPPTGAVPGAADTPACRLPRHPSGAAGRPPGGGGQELQAEGEPGGSTEARTQLRWSGGHGRWGWGFPGMPLSLALAAHALMLVAKPGSPERPPNPPPLRTHPRATWAVCRSSPQ